MKMTMDMVIAYCMLWCAVWLFDPSYIIASNTRFSWFQWHMALVLCDWTVLGIWHLELMASQSQAFSYWVSRTKAILFARDAFEVHSIVDHCTCPKTSQLLVKVKWLPSPVSISSASQYKSDVKYISGTHVFWIDSWVPSENILTRECIDTYWRTNRQRQSLSAHKAPRQ